MSSADHVNPSSATAGPSNYRRGSAAPESREPQSNSPDPQSSIVALTHVSSMLITKLSAIENRLHTLESGSGTPVRPTPERPIPEQPAPRQPSPIAVGRTRSHRAPEDDETISINIPPPEKFSGDRAALEGFLFQLEAYFTLKNVVSNKQKLAVAGMSLKDPAFSWWKPNVPEWRSWGEAKNALQAYYGDYYKADHAYREIQDLKQTGSVQNYLGAIDRLNAYAQIPPAQLIRAILTGIKPRLRLNMAHYESLRNKPLEWRKKLVEMDVVQTELQPAKTSGNQPSKRSYSDRSSEQRYTQGVKQKSTYDEVSKEAFDRRKKENRCLKCGKTGHRIADCQSTSYRRTPPPANSPKASDSAHPPKKPKTDAGTIRITELASEPEPDVEQRQPESEDSDSGNE